MIDFNNVYTKFNEDKNPVASDIDLDDGIYKGYFYSWILEINGIKYKTNFGIKCSKEFCGGMKNFIIKNGEAYEC